jgi:hypothetical protein
MAPRSTIIGEEFHHSRRKEMLVSGGFSASGAGPWPALPALRINHDPGNAAWFQRRDPIDDFRAAAPNIANVHVKDLKPFQAAVRPEFVPAGEGIVDYRAISPLCARPATPALSRLSHIGSKLVAQSHVAVASYSHSLAKKT